MYIQEKWILEVRTKVIAELDSMEGGVRFRQAVELVLRREQNWVRYTSLSSVSIILTHLLFTTLGQLEASRLRAVREGAARTGGVREGQGQVHRGESKTEALHAQARQRKSLSRMAVQHYQS